MTRDLGELVAAGRHADAVELFHRSIGVRYRGRPLVSIGAARHHLSLFVMYGKVLDRYAAELEGYDTSNTVVRFAPGEVIPADLVTRLVRARAAEVDGIVDPGDPGP